MASPIFFALLTASVESAELSEAGAEDSGTVLYSEAPAVVTEASAGTRVSLPVSETVDAPSQP